MFFQQLDTMFILLIYELLLHHLQRHLVSLTNKPSLYIRGEIKIDDSFWFNPRG